MNKRDHSQMTWKDLALTVGVAAFCWLLWVMAVQLGLLV